MGCAFVPVFLLLAQDAKQQEQPTPQKIKEWASKLGGESPALRDNATKRLIEAGAAAMEDVKKLVSSRDAEVQARAKHILDAIENEQLKAVGKRAIFLDKEKKVKLELVWIKPGTFTMGEGNETHQVTLTKGFWVGATEVTQEQWTAVMENNPSLFKGDPKLPVESVSWDDCQEFLKKAGNACGVTLDLPTEAEWEYACRAGSTGWWSFGDDESRLGDFAWHRANSGGKTHPVGEKKPNAWGLYDMHGNVWEWCKDYYDKYSGDAIDPKGPDSGERRVLRGGSWNGDPDGLRSALRVGDVPAGRDNCIGGRVVLR